MQIGGVAIPDHVAKAMTAAAAGQRSALPGLGAVSRAESEKVDKDGFEHPPQRKTARQRQPASKGASTVDASKGSRFRGLQERERIAGDRFAVECKTHRIPLTRRTSPSPSSATGCA